MGFNTGLIIIFSLASGFWLAFLFLIRNIRYFGTDTDNMYLVRAAAQSPRWKWLSDLHKFGEIKTGMMDMTVIGIAFFQKIFRDKEGDYPYIAWGGFTAAVAAILTYLIGTGYWNPEIGLVLSLLLLVSFWLWQIALYGGHANTAAVLALTSIYLTQQIHDGTSSPILWLFLGGIFYGLTQFSSRSAIKYTPLFLAAIFYEKYKTWLDTGQIKELGGLIIANHLLWPSLIIFGLAALSFLIAKLTYKKIVSAMYFKKAPAFLNRMIASRDQFDLAYYLRHAKTKINSNGFRIISVLAFLLLAVNLIGLNYFLPALAGVLAVILAFTLPDIKENLKYGLSILLETQLKTKSHFRLYVDYFARKGIAVSRDTRGGGWPWLPKVFFRMAPFHSWFFLVATAGLLTISLRMPGINIININLALLILLSLSPILWAQVTGAPQVARAFSPGLISILLVTGYFMSVLKINLWFPVLIAVIPAFTWNVWKFFEDIYPARLVAINLTKTLLALKIKEFYTYNTQYNNSLVNVIDPLVLKNIKVNYIQTLNEVKDGWIVIPCTSSKSMHMSSERESVRDGDYTKDPALNKLLKTRRIEKIASAKFKTFGSSNIWVQESEVTSYRDLILKEITGQDRFRGYAWLIHSSRL